MKWLLSFVVLLMVTTSWAGETTLPVSAEDTLRWENLALKIQLHGSRVQAIQRDVQDAAQQLAVERDTFVKSFEKSYGVSPERVERKGEKWIVKPEPPKAPTKETK